MKRLILSVLFFSVSASTAGSQGQNLPQPGLQGLYSATRVRSSANPSAFLSKLESLKRPRHYTAKDWRALIDSVWGPGLPTATKLQIFDTFWSLIDREYAGFPYLNVNWDSLKSLYRPEVAAGVSRAGFRQSWVKCISHFAKSTRTLETQAWIAPSCKEGRLSSSQVCRCSGQTAGDR